MINILAVVILGIIVIPMLWVFFNPDWMENMNGKNLESFSINIRRIVFKLRAIKHYLARAMKTMKKHLFGRSPRPGKV